MMLHFPIKLEPDDNGTLLVTCPLLPEVTSFGDDEAGALRHAADAIEEALAARISNGLDIPVPSARPARSRASRRYVVALPLMTALKVALYHALREAKITRAELTR